MKLTLTKITLRKPSKSRIAGSYLSYFLFSRWYNAWGEKLILSSVSLIQTLGHVNSGFPVSFISGCVQPILFISRFFTQLGNLARRLTRPQNIVLLEISYILERAPKIHGLLPVRTFWLVFAICSIWLNL